ncbi:hypothetical protein ACP70R_022664 [Stipagrostis hirtigluma subsp. patula]
MPPSVHALASRRFENRLERGVSNRLERVFSVLVDKPGECDERHNQFAMMFNAELQEAVRSLNGELAGAQVVYAEKYSVMSAILANPKEYGFENAAQGCCGTGLVETSFLCALDAPLTCKDANKYVFFDSAHPTQKTYNIEARAMLKTELQAFL